MQVRQYHAGEVLFCEDDASDFACRLVAGTADIVKLHDGEAVILGSAGPGEFVGEMGVIEGLPRSATVVAASAVTAEIHPKATLLKRISTNKDLALRLLVRLSERLKAANRALIDAVTTAGSGPTATTPVSGQPGVQLFADGAQLAAALPRDGIVVETFPFVVGRERDTHAPWSAATANLALPDARPYRLSRAHFEIDVEDGAFVVRDLRSTLGTTVNGRGLGRMFGADTAALEAGENLVVAGDRRSPFRFRILIQPDH